MLVLGEYVRLSEAIKIVAKKQGDESFDLKDLSRLIKHNVLNLYVEFVSPEPSNVLFFDGEFAGEEDFESEIKYKKVSERAIHNPVDTDVYLSNAKSYDIGKSIDEELEEKNSFEYFSKSDASNKLVLMPYQLHSITYRDYDNAWWLISKKELYSYLNSKEVPNREFWVKLKENLQPIGGFLCEVAKAYCGEKVSLPDYDDMLDWLDKNKDHKALKKYEIKIDLMKQKQIIIREEKTPLKPHLKNRWNDLKKKSKKIKNDLAL